MKELLNSRMFTNILLMLIVVMLATMFVVQINHFSGIEKSLRFIGNDTSEIADDTGITAENSKYR
ncbi:MAG: hypothetical protein MUF19_03920 [Candidatus Pacebacteria bacterium]|jgi:hypothetical protein|nr:hypothetical protein [Candidatus Paceibacterota bacterium]